MKIFSVLMLVLSVMNFATAQDLNSFNLRPPFPGNPGNGPGQPPNGPGNPPYPPQPPGYNDIYGPPRTVRWHNLGTIKTKKFIETRVRFNINGHFINEVFFAAEKNHVEIRSALIYLSNGQMFEARNFLGTLRDGQQTRQLLDYRNSLRVDRIELTIASPNLIGSAAQLHLQLGLAY